MDDTTDFAVAGSAVDERGKDRPERQLWLTMQAAHRRWTNATDALDEITATARANAEISDGALWIAKAEDEQRVAFQEYIEARLAFSESFSRRRVEEERDEEYPPELRGALAAVWAAGKTSRYAIALGVAAVLCPLALGVAFVSHERRHMQELGTAREELKAALAQERVRQENRATALPVSDKPSATAPVAAAPAKPPAHTATAPPIALASRPRPATRNVEFSVAPSARFSSVGPVRVAVHHLDYSSGTFDMSILLGDFRWEKRHVRRNERISLNVGANTAPMRLVVDRIGRKGVHGYLITDPAAATPASNSGNKALALSSPPRWARAD